MNFSMWSPHRVVSAKTYRTSFSTEDLGFYAHHHAHVLFRSLSVSLTGQRAALGELATL